MTGASSQAILWSTGQPLDAFNKGTSIRLSSARSSMTRSNAACSATSTLRGQKLSGLLSFQTPKSLLGCKGDLPQLVETHGEA
jgi:hypothetical protein